MNNQCGRPKECKRGPKHRLKILAGVFRRRHSSPTYDTYERIHFEGRPTRSPALHAGTEENHGGCLPGQRFERPALRGSSRRQLPDIGYLDQEGQAILHVHNSEFLAFRIPFLVPALIEVSGNAPADAAMEISLPGGARLSLTSANQVALAVALIRQLQQSRPC
jgi:hypothetical protein